MAPIQQEAEIQFAQRLASNEKPIRTKAIKKLRKYISVRAQKINGGFTGDELLKLWKGLFYCLWMQDKPLLQEELSNQISGLMHSFQNVQSMFLFLETFLQTIKREWTGIDMLRMDKFFQLVRFVFRNSFEMMKRKEWETSVVTRFLELLTAQVLHSTSGDPCGLQFHILDLYMTELAAVGSAELTAAQNLTFIDPFCKTASKTKDRILLKAICGSIFSAIVAQAPFAIEDLLKEVNATGGGSEESDSGQASEEEEEKKEPPKGKKAAKKSPMKTIGKQTNCTASTEEDEGSLEDEEDDEMLHLESDSESEIPDDGGIGPVLQFDYSALADRLFGLASRSNTPSHNRQRLYKVIKTLRDLSDGVFPQDEYPEEVSTDEDDDEMFGSRKRMKRGRALEEEESSPAKKRKGKKNDSKPGKSGQRAASDKSKPAKTPGDTTTRKKRSMGEVKSGEQNRVAEESEVKAEADTTPPTTESETTDAKKAAPTEAKTELSVPIDSVEAGVKKKTSTPAERTDVGEKQEAVLEEDASPMKVTDTPSEVTAMETEVQSETPPDIVVGSLSSVMEIGQKTQSETPVPDSTSSKKKKKTKKSKTPVQEEEKAVTEPETNTDVPEASVKATETEDQAAPATQDGEAAEGATEPESAPETATTSTTKRKGRRKSTKQDPEEQTTVEEVETKPDAVEEIMDTPLKKNRRKKAERSAESTKEEVAETDSAPVDTTPAGPKPLATPAEEPPVDVRIATTSLKKKKLKAAKSEEESVEVEGEMQPETEADVLLVVAETVPAEAATPTVLKKKMAEEQSVEAEGKTKTAADSNRTLVDAEAELVEVSTPAPLKKKKKKAALVSEEQEPDTTAVEESIAEEQPTKVDLETPVKKRKIPVVIEVEAEELEAEAEAARVNDSEEPSTPVNAKKTKKMMPKKAKGGEESDFITFQSHATIPTPIFFKRAKGSPSTSLSSKKKCPTPKSESKKVTFGLNKNKIAEFRKTDRSLLVSPEGSSRVPFDPLQKPLFGVLKSPVASLTNSTKKKTKSTPKATPKRPTAADFF
ncbi:ribosomal RNA processing protein 1 homolog B-like [Salvelinus namaycush]|uniref:Ribosomal RNA processing protein 1 homolog B-like n=1 Tax=Salvelinus namaycush TaxID=8040 RepID=A0A8U1F6M6_SALNM|nr:ribosomal RNA processing protein 1 homolog B-like [Salvelinus namaycush]